MAGKPSNRMRTAMRHVLKGKTPYEAANLAEVAQSTMYRSRLYKIWRDDGADALKAELAKNGA